MHLSLVLTKATFVVSIQLALRETIHICWYFFSSEKKAFLVWDYKENKKKILGLIYTKWLMKILVTILILVLFEHVFFQFHLEFHFSGFLTIYLQLTCELCTLSVHLKDNL